MALQIAEVNSELLFGNLHEVTCVSHDMVGALREACQAEEKVGAVFVRFGPRLRTTYAIYCRSHDMASSLVEKVSILFLAEHVLVVESPLRLCKVFLWESTSCRYTSHIWSLNTLRKIGCLSTNQIYQHLLIYYDINNKFVV